MGGYDGEVRIKTTMELKELEKNIREAERKLKDYEKEAERLARQRAKTEAEIEEKRAEARSTKTRSDRIKEILEKRERSGQSTDTGIYGDLKLEYQQLDETYKRLSQEVTDLEAKTNKAIESNQNNIKGTKDEIEGLVIKYNQAKEELVKYNQELEQQRQHEKQIQEIKRSIDNVGNSVTKVTKRIIGWGLSLVGINSLMGLVSRSLTLLKNEDKQLGANLNYISFALANAIKPLVEKIVNLVLKLMTYINYIWVKWFGKNLFKDSGAKEYEKSMKNSSKSAKQIKKDLMGFDEVNKLSENSSSGGGSGFVSPSMDLSKIDDIKPPWWIDWIATHKDDILRVIDALISLFVFKKTIDWLLPLANFFGLFTGGKLAGGIGGVKGALKGLFTTSKDIFTGWKGFGIGLLASLPIIIATVENAKNKLKETYEYQKKISEQGAKYSKEFVENTDDLVELNDDLNYRQNMTKQNLRKLNQFGSSIYKDFYKIVGATGSWVENTNDTLRNSDDILKKEIDLYRQGKLTDEQKKELIKKILEQRNLLLDVQDTYEMIGEDTSGIVEMSEYYKDVLGELGVKAYEMTTPFDIMHENTKKTSENVGNILTDMAELINTKIPKKTLEIDTKVNTGGIGTAINTMGKSIGQMISKLSLKSLFDDLEKKFPSGFSVMGVKMFDFKKLRKSLGLRQGGIINNPGRGVALSGNIIGGEAGAEAVLPLDDNTMDRLGSAIARHMNVNLTNVNQMNGRVISRELKQIMNESDFSYNG